jgi:lipopolysaccharide biosynthesis glycosyltransferase
LSVLHVSCAAEGGYVAHSATMLHSVLENADTEIHVHYLRGPRFAPRSAEAIAAMVRKQGATIEFLEIPDAWCAGLPTEGFTRLATWYRIFLPQLLPDVERILYLDSDLLVLDSLAPLAEIDLSEHYLGAVTNVFEPEHLRRPTKLGLDSPLAYFNAGVMLMNLDLMRRDGCTEALRKFAIEHAEQLAWRDQDAVNVVLGSRRLPLHPRWNCMNSVLNFPWSPYVFGVDAVDEAHAKPAIRHFEGPGVNKPWHFLCDRRMQKLYARHRLETPWPKYRVEGVTPANFGRRVARTARRQVAALRRRPGHDPSLVDRDPDADRERHQG